MLFKVSMNLIGFIIFLSFFNLAMVLSRNQIIKRTNISLSFLHSLVLILFIIPEILLYCLTKKEQYSESITRSSAIIRKKLFRQIPAQHNKHYREKIVFLFLLGVLASLLPLFEFFINYWEYISLYNPNMILNFIFTWAFSFIFFRIPMHIHQIISLIIMIIMRVIFCIIYQDIFVLIAQINSLGWGYYLMQLLAFIITISSREVLEKYLIDLCFMSSFMILFIEGCVSLCINIALFFSLQATDCSKMKYNIIKELCENSTWSNLKAQFSTIFNQSELIVCLFSMVAFLFLVHCFRIYINKNISSSHRYLADSLTELYYYSLFLWIPAFHFPFKPLDVVNIVVVLIGCLVYNETIILYFCGLEKNTKIEIQRRQEEDFLETNSSANLFDDDYETD